MFLRKNILDVKGGQYDYLIVGAGFAGSVLAERLNAIGRRVLVVDKRGHIGGNAYDYYNEFGVLVHKYGPHYFRTNFDEVKNYLSRFTKWRIYRYKIKASISGHLYAFPINRNTLNEFFNVNLRTGNDAQKFLDSKRLDIKNPKNAEEQVLALVGREIYSAFFKNYTIKQWGIHPKKLSPSVTARIPIRTNTDDGYLSDKFQAMPKDGYRNLFENLLEGIEVVLKADYEDIRYKIGYKRLIYTGPIDAFFNYKYGKLSYRSLYFKFENYDKEFYQDYSQINYPNERRFTRIVEIKHVTGQKIPRTTIVREYPKPKGEPYYPIPSRENEALYNKYKREAEELKNVYFVGRLAEYKYLNMDQVVKAALDLFEKLEN